MNTPKFKVIVGKQDITPNFTTQVRSLILKRSDKLLVDRLYVEIDNRDRKIEIPDLYSTITLRNLNLIGCQNNLIFYIHNDKDYKSDENTGIIKLSARSINFSTVLGNYTREFKKQTLEEILQVLANLLNIQQVVITDTLKIIKIIYYLQHNKSNIEAIQELADIFYAVANIRNNTLYFLQKRVRKFDYTKEILLSKILKYKNVKTETSQYNGIEYSYWEHGPTNITHKQEGTAPFFKLANVYEKSLATMYYYSKLNELEEDKVIEIITEKIIDIRPRYYFRIRTDKNTVAKDNNLSNILGSYSVKECIISYGYQQESNKEHNEAAPSTKKAKLEPSWSTSLKLVRITNI